MRLALIVLICTLCQGVHPFSLKDVEDECAKLREAVNELKVQLGDYRKIQIRNDMTKMIEERLEVMSEQMKRCENGLNDEGVRVKCKDSVKVDVEALKTIVQFEIGQLKS